MGLIRTLGLNGAAVWAAIYHRFALFHVFLLEQKLTIQVGQVNGVKVQYGDMAKSSHDDILQKFTSDTTSAN
jgi:hypothetical protein